MSLFSSYKPCLRPLLLPHDPQSPSLTPQPLSECGHCVRWDQPEADSGIDARPETLALWVLVLWLQLRKGNVAGPCAGVHGFHETEIQMLFSKHSITVPFGMTSVAVSWCGRSSMLENICVLSLHLEPSGNIAGPSLQLPSHCLQERGSPSPPWKQQRPGKVPEIHPWCTMPWPHFILQLGTLAIGQTL